MPNLTRQPFDPSKKKLLVRRDFRAGGRMLRHGSVFPWKRLGVTPRRLRQLYEAGFLHYEEEKKPEPEPEPETPVEESPSEE